MAAILNMWSIQSGIREMPAPDVAGFKTLTGWWLKTILKDDGVRQWEG